MKYGKCFYMPRTTVKDVFTNTLAGERIYYYINSYWVPQRKLC